MKVKHVNFNVTLEGNGIVNFDSGEQKYLWNRESKAGFKNKFTSADNNNMYAKKHYIRNENGELDYKIKLSSDCLRNAIFSGDAIATNPSITHHSVLLNSFIGSTLGLVRGYMFATKTNILKRKSPLTITSATQTNDAESYMEFFSRSGMKKIGDDSGTKDTTIFNKETIGDITYEAKGFINIQSLQFLSSDPIFDRFSFNSDEFELLKTFLSGNLPKFDSEMGYYSLKTSAIDVAEFGIKLNQENIIFLIKETLKRILSINILRSGSFAKTTGLTIELVYDPINSITNKSITINSIEDIDNLDFEVEEFYILADESEAKKQRELIEERIKLEAKQKEDTKKEGKKSKKEDGE
jgi:hypothetical protein